MQAHSISFVGALCFHVRELRPVLQENLFENSDNGYDLIPHLVMSAIAFWTVDRFLTQGPDDGAVGAIMSFLENAYGTDDPSIDNVIETSFLENLPYPGEAGTEIVALLGPRLAKTYEFQINWKPNA